MKISVVTPNYNYAAFIGQTIESVLAQNDPNCEHVIVDDGSTDNSVDIIRNYANRYPGRVVLVCQENKGQTPAINVGMKQVSGDVICWINSDDTFCPGVFAAVRRRFEQHPDTDIVFGDMNVTDLQGRLMYRRRHLDFSFTSGCLLGFTTVLSSNAVFWRKTAMLKNGYFNESLKCNMDGDFYARLTQGMRVRRIELPFANFRKQPHTKAAETNSNWNALVAREVQMEREAAYARLAVSRWIPFRFSALVRWPVHLRRVTARALKGHFAAQKRELALYQQTHA